MVIEQICKTCGNRDGCIVLTLKEMINTTLPKKACIVIDERGINK